MGFWSRVGKLVDAAIEHGPAIMEALQAEGAKKQAEIQKGTQQRIQAHERNINRAANSERMQDPNFARKVKEEKAKIENAKVQLYTGNAKVHTDKVKVAPSGVMTFGGLTVDQWNNRWIPLGRLDTISLGTLTNYNNKIGLYKAEIDGKVAYIGRAIEWNNGGFRKRLRDYVRDSDSGRTHGSGKLMNQNADRIHLSILIVGDSAEDVETVKALEVAMIGKLRPNWNVQNNR